VQKSNGGKVPHLTSSRAALEFLQERKTQPCSAAEETAIGVVRSIGQASNLQVADIVDFLGCGLNNGFQCVQLEEPDSFAKTQLTSLA
jgi:hypothetical protein